MCDKVSVLTYYINSNLLTCHFWQLFKFEFDREMASTEPIGYLLCFDVSILQNTNCACANQGGSIYPKGPKEHEESNADSFADKIYILFYSESRYPLPC